MHHPICGIWVESKKKKKSRKTKEDKRLNWCDVRKEK